MHTHSPHTNETTSSVLMASLVFMILILVAGSAKSHRATQAAAFDRISKFIPSSDFSREKILDYFKARDKNGKRSHSVFCADHDGCSNDRHCPKHLMHSTWINEVRMLKAYRRSPPDLRYNLDSEAVQDYIAGILLKQTIAGRIGGCVVTLTKEDAYEILLANEQYLRTQIVRQQFQLAFIAKLFHFFFIAIMNKGDRPVELTQVLAEQAYASTSKGVTSIHLNVVNRKIRNSPHHLMLPQSPDQLLCPVLHFQQYIRFAHQLKVCISTPSTSKPFVPFIFPDIEQRGVPPDTIKLASDAGGFPRPISTAKLNRHLVKIMEAANFSEEKALFRLKDARSFVTLSTLEQTQNQADCNAQLGWAPNANYAARYGKSACFQTMLPPLSVVNAAEALELAPIL